MCVSLDRRKDMLETVRLLHMHCMNMFLLLMLQKNYTQQPWTGCIQHVLTIKKPVNRGTQITAMSPIDALQELQDNSKHRTASYNMWCYAITSRVITVLNLLFITNISSVCLFEVFFIQFSLYYCSFYLFSSFRFFYYYFRWSNLKF